MNGKYLFNLKFATPANIDVSLSVTADDLDTIVRDSVEAYVAFKKALWDNTTHAPAAKPVEAAKPAQATKPIQAAIAAPAAKPTQATKAQEPQPVCPEHNKSRLGKYGLFCPAKVNETPGGDPIYCDWKPAGQQ